MPPLLLPIILFPSFGLICQSIKLIRAFGCIRHLKQKNSKYVIKGLRSLLDPLLPGNLYLYVYCFWNDETWNMLSLENVEVRRRDYFWKVVIAVLTSSPSPWPYVISWWRFRNLTERTDFEFNCNTSYPKSSILYLFLIK